MAEPAVAREHRGDQLGPLGQRAVRVDRGVQPVTELLPARGAQPVTGQPVPLGLTQSDGPGQVGQFGKAQLCWSHARNLGPDEAGADGASQSGDSPALWTTSLLASSGARWRTFRPEVSQMAPLDGKRGITAGAG